MSPSPQGILSHAGGMSETSLCPERANQVRTLTGRCKGRGHAWQWPGIEGASPRKAPGERLAPLRTHGPEAASGAGLEREAPRAGWGEGSSSTNPNLADWEQPSRHLPSRCPLPEPSDFELATPGDLCADWQATCSKDQAGNRTEEGQNQGGRP